MHEYCQRNLTNVKKISGTCFNPAIGSETRGLSGKYPFYEAGVRVEVDF